MFDNLDEIDIATLTNWLKPIPDLTLLENHLAHRILYPDVIPVTAAEVQYDLAILREAIRNYTFATKDEQLNPLLGNNSFYNFTLRKIMIPKTFLTYSGNLENLILVFADVLLVSIEKKDWFEDFWTIVLTSDVDEVLGSLLIPQFEKNGNLLKAKVSDKSYDVNKGEFVVIPCGLPRSKVTYEIDAGKLLDRQSNSVEISGGRVGIVVDGRRK